MTWIAAREMVFISRNTPHGRVRLPTPTFSALSIYAPYFDRSKKNIVWERETAH